MFVCIASIGFGVVNLLIGVVMVIVNCLFVLFLFVDMFVIWWLGVVF